MESTGAADDDLSWWSVIFEKVKNRGQAKEKGTNAGTSALRLDWPAAEQRVRQFVDNSELQPTHTTQPSNFHTPPLTHTAPLKIAVFNSPQFHQLFIRDSQSLMVAAFS